MDDSASPVFTPFRSAPAQIASLNNPNIYPSGPHPNSLYASTPTSGYISQNAANQAMMFPFGNEPSPYADVQMDENGYPVNPLTVDNMGNSDPAKDKDGSYVTQLRTIQSPTVMPNHMVFIFDVRKRHLHSTIIKVKGENTYRTNNHVLEAGNRQHANCRLAKMQLSFLEASGKLNRCVNKHFQEELYPDLTFLYEHNRPDGISTVEEDSSGGESFSTKMGHYNPTGHFGREVPYETTNRMVYSGESIIMNCLPPKTTAGSHYFEVLRPVKIYNNTRYNLGGIGSIMQTPDHLSDVQKMLNIESQEHVISFGSTYNDTDFIYIWQWIPMACPTNSFDPKLVEIDMSQTENASAKAAGLIRRQRYSGYCKAIGHLTQNIKFEGPAPEISKEEFEKTTRDYPLQVRRLTQYHDGGNMYLYLYMGDGFFF